VKGEEVTPHILRIYVLSENPICLSIERPTKSYAFHEICQLLQRGLEKEKGAFHSGAPGGSNQLIVADYNQVDVLSCPPLQEKTEECICDKTNDETHVLITRRIGVKNQEWREKREWDKIGRPMKRNTMQQRGK
jgi:hypothetical protein